MADGAWSGTGPWSGGNPLSQAYWWLPAASEFSREMWGPDYGQLVGAQLSDQAAATPQTGGGWGQMMYGPGETGEVARGAKQMATVPKASQAGMQRRVGGAQDWMNMAGQFAQTTARQEQLNQEQMMNKWGGIGSLVGMGLHGLSGLLFGATPGNLLGSLLGLPNLMQSGGLLGSIGGSPDMSQYLANLGPGGTGLTGLMQSMFQPSTPQAASATTGYGPMSAATGGYDPLQLIQLIGSGMI